MFDNYTWHGVHGDELGGFLNQVNPVDGKFNADPASSKVAWTTLPFYDQVAMISIEDPNWNPAHLRVYYLTDRGTLYRLNGTSPPIHEVNGKAPVKINENNVLDYLRFFCFFVRGEEGPFLIAEDVDGPYVPSNVDDKTRKVIENTVRPASYEGRNEQGHYLCDAVVFYSNALFIANFAVHDTGMIEMLDDEPIAADLPAKVDAPVA